MVDAPPAGMPNDMPRDASATSTPPHDAPSRVLQFARRHPVLTVVGAGGAAMIGGIELAFGVLIGAGVTTLIRRSGRMADATSPESADGARQMREEIEHEERERAAPREEAQVRESGAHEERDRTRDLLQRAPEIVRRRARAVVQAARGKLAPSA